MYDDLYCKVFVDTDMDYEKLFALLINCIDGKKEAVNYIIFICKKTQNNTNIYKLYTLVTPCFITCKK